MISGMARAIIRSSINGPSPNNVQHQLRSVLESVGFEKIGTAAYEGHFQSGQEALAALEAGINFLYNLPAGYELDHLWTYVD